MSKKNLKKANKTSDQMRADDVSQLILSEIRSGSLKMRPKMFYWLGSILLFAGIVLVTVVGIFSAAILRFITREHGPMGEVRLAQLLSSIPWWLPIVMIVCVIVGVWLIKKAEFGYRVMSWQVLLLAIGAMMLGGYFADQLGLGSRLMNMGERAGGGRRMMRQPGGKAQPKAQFFIPESQ